MTKILLAAILALGTTTMAFAAPVKMTDNQLDQVTAGCTPPHPEKNSSSSPAAVGADAPSVEISQNINIKISDLPANGEVKLTDTLTLLISSPGK